MFDVKKEIELNNKDELTVFKQVNKKNLVKGGRYDEC